MRKPVFGVSDQVRHKPGCSIKDGLRKWRDCTIRVAKTKALISFAVTAKLICVFVFAYAKSRFSHNEADYLPVKIVISLALFSIKFARNNRRISICNWF